jgi:dCTP deaminase
MTILSDREIRSLAILKNMIFPFEGEQIKTGISYGLSSYGYDVRLANEFKVCVDPKDTEFDEKIDPKNPENLSNIFTDILENYRMEVAPNSFILGRSLEWIKVPRDILVICLGKSSLARVGIIINVTPLEPEWEGHITIEIANQTRLPAIVYPNEGIAQLIFLKASNICENSYQDRKGKYQCQRGVTLSKLIT